MSSGSSVQSVPGALIELITNSLDAYANINPKNVWLYLTFNTDSTIYTVIDNACGMSFTDMSEKLMIVGNYTASNNSRGIYSTGAKDCASLGDISFTSIKDNLISSITISSISTGANITINMQDELVTDAQRTLYRITSNGTYVTLTVPNYLGTYTTSQLYSLLCNNVYLRLINTDINNCIIIEDNNGFSKNLNYTLPNGKTIIQAIYQIPGYAGANANLSINVTDTQIAFNPITPPDKDCRQWGLLVYSQEKSIYDNNFLYYSGDASIVDFTWDANARYVYGTLQCSYIDQILLDGCNGKFSITNPFLIYSPSRKGGLNTNHPFTKALYQTGYNYLSVVIAKLQDRRDQCLLDSDSTLSSLMGGLNNFMSNLIIPPNEIYRFRTPQDSNNIIQAALNSSNVELDSQFLGVTYDEIIALSKGESVPLINQPITNNSNSVNIVFSNDKNMTAPYQILHGKNITLKINANDPGILPYLNVSSNSISMNNPGKALVSLSGIISEVTSNLQVRQNILNGNSSLDTQTFNDYLSEYIDYKTKNASGLSSLINNMIKSVKSNATPLILKTE
jgi:hypothetical protein